MKLITRDTDYAMRALAYIAERKGEVVSVPELLAALKIPRPFLRKILQSLGHGGFLRSTRGRGGGFLLARKPGAIALTDVMRLFQGPVKLNECIFKRRLCPNRPTCPLKKKIDAIERYVVTELQTFTIADLLTEGAAR